MQLFLHFFAFCLKFCGFLPCLLAYGVRYAKYKMKTLRFKNDRGNTNKNKWVTFSWRK